MTKAHIKVVGDNNTTEKWIFSATRQNCVTLQQTSSASSSDGA